MGAAAPVRGAQPNILFILADDLDSDYKQDRLAIMPNLRKLREAGVHFINHVAAQPVCGPSRSSLLQGRFPHNVKYYANEDPPSVANYLAIANNSVGTWLTAAGYHTAFIVRPFFCAACRPCATCLLTRNIPHTRIHANKKK